MRNSYVKGFYPVVWVLVACLIAGVIVHQIVGADAGVETEPFALTDFLSTDRSDSDEVVRYQKADPEYQLRFPDDHADHPGFRSEWWYLNGNLRHRDDPSQRFGFQFTVFRQALAPNADRDTDPQQTDWLAPQFYMGHVGLADFSRKQHLAAERFSRQGPGLAGVTAQPLRVWLEGWSLAADNPAALFPATLEAHAQGEDGNFSYRLRVVPDKPLVLQGQNGYSPKRPEAGFASHYYSYTRLRVEGEIQLEGEWLPVVGSAWYDHEWSSNSLAPYQAGWDWFSIQLDDGHDLMVMALRSKKSSGKADFMQASMFDASGRSVALNTRDIQLEVLEQWCADDGVCWPSGWRLQIPSKALDLTIRPRLKSQENRLAVRYWEGAIAVNGSHTGEGYVELTGYADREDD